MGESSSFDLARDDLVQLKGATPAQWRIFVEQQVAAAYTSGDLDALANAVQFMTWTLDAEGRYDEALLEVQHAVLLAKPESDAVGLLHALHASLLSATGRLPEARAALAASERVLATVGEPGSRRWLALCEAERLKLLQPPSRRLADLLRPVPGENIDTLFVLSWLIPYEAARGHLAALGPLIREFHALAASTGHVWRAEDSAVFDHLVAVVSGKRSRPPTATVNHLARFRSRCLALFAASDARRIAVAERNHAAIARAQVHSGGLYTGPPAAWDAWRAALVAVAAPSLAPPSDASLLDLGAWLAAADATALAGSAADAAVWENFLHGLGEAGIRSSLEWPVWIPRLEGLLALRRRDRRSRALRLLKASTVEASEAGFAVEAEIARLQHAHLAALTWPGDREKWHAVASAAGRTLIGWRVDPLPHIHTVTATAPEKAGRAATAGVTPREVAVLRLLDAGHTYVRAGNELGISWQTVRTITHRAYEKLGASSRSQALAEARRRRAID